MIWPAMGKSRAGEREQSLVKGGAAGRDDRPWVPERTVVGRREHRTVSTAQTVAGLNSREGGEFRLGLSLWPAPRLFGVMAVWLRSRRKALAGAGRREFGISKRWLRSHSPVQDLNISGH